MDKKIYIGAAYYPEHWPKERWSKDIQMMKEAGINVLRMAELAWSFLEPEDSGFDFGWLDEFISMAYKEGIEVILGTPIEATPTWLNNMHPEIIAADEFGRIHGGRGRHCYNNENFIEHVERIVNEMAAHYASNPAVIGWQTDNEIRAAKCYCPKCTGLYRKWLQNRYGTLEKLNEEWGTRFWSQVYKSWDEVKLPAADQLTVSVSQILDHSRFASHSAVEHSNRQAEIIKRHAPHQFVTHNTMGLYPWLDVYKLSEKLDFISWDSYPGVDDDNFLTCMSHDHQRGAKQSNFWVMEQKNGYFNGADYNLAIEPGLVRLWGFQDIARGADGVVFYRWRSGRYNVEQNPNGILRHDGTPRRAYYEIKKLTGELGDFGEALAGTRVEAPVAIIYSYDQIWALESNRQYKSFDYVPNIMPYYKALAGMGVTADLVDPLADLSKYRMVIAPSFIMVSSEAAANLKKYVSDGGCLVFGARSGNKTWSNVTVDTPWPGLLSELTGIVIDEFEVLADKYFNTVSYKGKEYDVRVWLDMLECGTAETLAVYSGKFYAGRTAVSRNVYGSGTAVYVGVMGNDELIKDILSDALKECGIDAGPLPEGIFVTKRVSDSNAYTFIINAGRETKRVYVDKPGIDLLSKRHVFGEAFVKGLDVMVVRSEL